MSSPCFYMLSAPHTRASFLSIPPGQRCQRYFRTLLICRFLCLLPGKGAFESLFLRDSPSSRMSNGPSTPRLAQARQRRAGPSTSQPVLLSALVPRASGGRPWPCRAGPMRRRVERGPASRLGACRPRRASQPSVAPPSEDHRKEPTPETPRDRREQVDSQ